MNESLAVWLYDEHVADVLDAGLGQCALRYTDRALARGPAARLSLSLPVREETYAAVQGAMRWLRALLPEGRAFQAAVEEFGIPADDVFGLLSVLGRDVAGAVVIAPAGEPLTDPRAEYQKLSDNELGDLIRQAHHRPLSLSRDRGVRLSLAGVQDKLLLHRPPRSSRYYLPVHGKPSTVIVKPEPPPDAGAVYTGLAANEAFCLMLANECRLASAQSRVLRTTDRTSLVVDRYDRHHAAGEVTRTHQEDMLSALGRDPWLKYERGNAHRELVGGGFTSSRVAVRSDPGPTLDDLAALTERHFGLAGLAHLIEIATFNVTIGNADAHARNLSIILGRDGSVRMAPLYDLVCTRFYPELHSDAAQFVNGVDEIDKITLDDLAEHARRWGLTDRVLQRIPRMAQTIHDRSDIAVRRAVDGGADEETTKQVATLIRSRAERLLS